MNLSVDDQTEEIKNSYTDELRPHDLSSYVFVVSLALMSAVIACCDIIAIVVMRRCKRVPYQCLQLSISYFLSEVIAMIFFMIHELIIFGFGINSNILYNTRNITSGTMYSISSASMAAIILERAFALKANLKYTLALKRAQIQFKIAMIWLVHILIIVGVTAISFHLQCSWVLKNCDISEVNKASMYCFTFFTFIYDVIMIFANVFVFRIARRHAVQIDALKQNVLRDEIKYPDTVSDRQYASIVVFVKIISFYLIFQIPLFIAAIIGTFFPEIRDELPIRIFRSFAYFCFLLNSFINLYYYILKIKECRMVLFFIIGKLIKKYEQKANDIRLQVYDIVPASERRKCVVLD